MKRGELISPLLVYHINLYDCSYWSNISKRGMFEIDDIINNTLGCAIGYGIVMIFISLFKRKK